jgi:hypothetical protein
MILFRSEAQSFQSPLKIKIFVGFYTPTLKNIFAFLRDIYITLAIPREDPG